MLRGDERIRLPKLSFEFLRVLVEAAPNLVTHDELAARVWGPRRTVTSENLTQRLLMLRHSLGDHAAQPRYIESLRAQGCRLVPTVEIVPTGVGDRQGTNRHTRGPWASSGAPRLFRGLFGAGVVATLVLTAVISWNFGLPIRATVVAGGDSAPAVDDRGRLANSIAVLPFEKLNAAPDDEQYFAEALHAQLINDLGNNDDLSVIARASVLAYRDRGLPIRTIAEQLNVGMIVTASVRYADDRMYVIAELLDANSGMQRWSDTYEVRPDDTFTAPREIAAKVVGALTARAPVGPATVERLPTRSVEAYAFFMRAMDIFNANTLGSRTTAQTYLDQALTLDPSFAHAYAGKALIQAFTIIGSGDAFEDAAASVAEREQLVRDFASKALALNPDTDLAYYALGVLHMFSWRWAEARENFAKAIDISPQHAVFLSQLGWLEACTLDDPEGRRYAERAVALDPKNPYVYELLGNVLQCVGDAEGALAVAERALDVDATSFANRVSRAFRIAPVRGREAALRELANLEPLLTQQRVLSLPAVALAYKILGQPAEARRLFDRFSEFAQARNTGPANWYLAYLAVGDYDNAYDKLVEASKRPGPGPGFYTLVSFMANPGTEPPFDEPRFLALRDRLRSNR